jgi:nucleoside-diphosphate-sugar epimerase
MTAGQRETKSRRSVLVAGAQGVSGSAMLKQYAALSGTTVYGLSRRPSESGGNVQHISVDLLNPDDIGGQARPAQGNNPPFLWCLH